MHRLKDLTAPERLYQLGDDEFPPLRTLDATNLPLTGTPLLGREKELEQLVALLVEGPRLVTITGPGGSGKTRLALQAAAELVGTFSDGVFWVPLAGLADPELVLPEIARTLPARDDLLGYLSGKQLLLLVDNFEHLLAAAPDLASLLASADGLRVLVTSRAPLRIAGEREYPLEPLPTQDAATLFLERARGVGKSLGHDPTIDSICRRLDGLPLAIELAAARTKLLSPEALLARLDDALSLLTSGARDAPERQRTLRATTAWSYDLLDEESKRVFSRISVFQGASRSPRPRMSATRSSTLSPSSSTSACSSRSTRTASSCSRRSGSTPPRGSRRPARPTRSAVVTQMHSAPSPLTVMRVASRPRRSAPIGSSPTTTISVPHSNGWPCTTLMPSSSWRPPWAGSGCLTRTFPKADGD